MNDDLHGYINEMLHLEYDFPFIKEELLRAGWDESSIEKAFHDYREVDSEQKSDEDKKAEIFVEQVAKPEPELAAQQKNMVEETGEVASESKPVPFMEEVEEQKEESSEAVPLIGMVPEKPQEDAALEPPRGVEDLKHPPKEEKIPIALPQKNKKEKKKAKAKEKESKTKRVVRTEKHSIAIPAVAGLLSLAAGIGFGYYLLAENFYDLSIQPDTQEVVVEME